MNMATQGIFVTGTDTAVGKTYLSCHIIQEMIRHGHSIGAYKPVCSGAITDANGKQVWEDVELLWDAIHRSPSLSDIPKSRVCPQQFRMPVAPDRAAKMESRQVDESLITSGWQWWNGQVDYLLVEGVGGILSPISDQSLVVDLAVQVGYPLLIIARAGLGTINHTLLTIEVARQHGLSIAGVVFNQATPELDSSARFNCEDLCLRTEVPFLGTMPFGSHSLLNHARKEANINWSELFDHSP